MNKLNLTKETTYLTKEEAIEVCNIFLREYQGIELTDLSKFTREEYYYERNSRFPGVDEVIAGKDKYYNTVVKYLVPLIFSDNKFRKNSEYALIQVTNLDPLEERDPAYLSLLDWGAINGFNVLWNIVVKSSLTKYEFTDRVRLKTKFYDFGFSIEFVLEHLDELKEDMWLKIKSINIIDKEDLFEIVDKAFTSFLFNEGYRNKEDILNSIYFECYCECYRKTQGSPQLLFDEMSNRGLLNKDKWIENIEKVLTK